MSLFDNILRARQEQAELSVHAYLAGLDNKTLKTLGVNRKDLKKGGRINHFL